MGSVTWATSGGVWVGLCWSDLKWTYLRVRHLEIVFIGCSYNIAAISFLQWSVIGFQLCWSRFVSVWCTVAFMSLVSWLILWWILWASLSFVEGSQEVSSSFQGLGIGSALDEARVWVDPNSLKMDIRWDRLCWRLFEGSLCRTLPRPAWSPMDFPWDLVLSWCGPLSVVADFRVWLCELDNQKGQKSETQVKQVLTDCTVKCLVKAPCGLVCHLNARWWQVEEAKEGFARSQLEEEFQP